MDISSSHLRALLEMYGRKPQQVEQRQQQERTAPAGQDEAQGQRDGLSISSEAREVLEVREQVLQAPEVRQERVDELRQQIQDGTYEVADQDIAQSLLEQLAHED